MANGRLKINPDVAKQKAETVKRIANELEELLNKVSVEMSRVNDADCDMYQGGKRPAELRNELDECRGTFHRIYDQVLKFSDNIILIADTAAKE